MGWINYLKEKINAFFGEKYQKRMLKVAFFMKLWFFVFIDLVMAYQICNYVGWKHCLIFTNSVKIPDYSEKLGLGRVKPHISKRNPTGECPISCYICKTGI